MQPPYHNATCLRGRRRLTIDKCMRARQQQYGEDRNSIGNRVDYDDEHDDTSIGYNNSADDGGIARSPLMNRSSWNVASSYHSLRPPLHLSPHIQLGEVEETTELDEEEEVWGSPDLVAAMRPLSSAACSWSNVAMVDSLAEGGLHLGPWASTAY
ncbi:hypothetical protein BGW42_006257 [Actinomortierella wolfii]|nr:hypothetical protein BGW42_006257 [Actinomortierella wolfii]